MQLSLADDRTRHIIFAILAGILFAIGGSASIAFVHPLVPFAVIGAVIVAAVVMSNIDFGMYAVIAITVLLPFAALPLNIGFNPTFLDLALVAVYAMWFARVMTRQDGHRFAFTDLGLLVLTFLILAVFSFIGGTAYAPITTQVLRQFAEVLAAITFFFVVVNIVRTRATLERYVTVLIIAGFISAALGILLYILPHDISIFLLSALRVFKYPTGDRVLRFINDDPANPMRATSTSVDPNVLGGLLILVTALTVPQLFAEKPLLPRKLIGVIVSTMLLCMVLTFSRGSLLGLGLAVLVIATVRYRPIIAVAMLAVIGVLFLPITQDYVGYFIDAFTAGDRSTQMRLGEYKDAFTLISRYPFFGVGFGGSPDVDTYLGVSSVYLLMAEEMGLIGLGVFLITMGTFFYQIVQAWFARIVHDKFLAPILLGLGGALLGAMIGGLVDHYFFNLQFTHSVVLFWLFVALGIVTIRLGTESKTETP